MPVNWSPDLAGRYQAVAFAELGAVRKDKQQQEATAAALGRLGLTRLPMPEQLTSVSAGPMMGFIGSDGVVTITFSDGRIDYIHNSLIELDRSARRGKATEIAERAADVLAAALGSLDRRSHRLAFLTEEFATDGTPRPTNYGEAAGALLKLPSGWGPSSLTEWTWKFSRRHSTEVESFNLLATVQASAGDVSGRKFEGLWFQIDANTSPDRSALRFGPLELRHAFEDLAQLVESTQLEVVSLLNAHALR